MIKNEMVKTIVIFAVGVVIGYAIAFYGVV